MTTVGGILELPLGLELAPMAPNLSPPAAWPTPSVEFGGKGLLRMSFTAVEDDVGVRTGDWVDGSRAEGEAVPSLESLFFLEDLVASLPRESWHQVSETTLVGAVRRIRISTYDFLTEALHPVLELLAHALSRCGGTVVALAG